MSAPLTPDWLVARPIAHRGQHDRNAGIIENSLSAARAAIEGGYAIECDVQLTADGDAAVYHDFTLERLTGLTDRVDALGARALRDVALAGSADRIATLTDILALIDARTPLICEIKSRFNGDMRLAERAAHIARAYGGPIALKSFDPAVMAHLRANRERLGIAHIPLGIVAQASYESDHEWAGLSAGIRRDLSQFLHWADTRPDFLSWSRRDLPHATPFLLRQVLGLPVMTWTVRTAGEAVDIATWTDQVVFEGFRP